MVVGIGVGMVVLGFWSGDGWCFRLVVFFEFYGKVVLVCF